MIGWVNDREQFCFIWRCLEIFFFGDFEDGSRGEEMEDDLNRLFISEASSDVYKWNYFQHKVVQSLNLDCEEQTGDSHLFLSGLM